MHPFPEWVEESEYRGHDGARTLIAVWTDNFDEFEFHIHEFREVGERVLVLGETAGASRARTFRSASRSGSSTPISVTA